MFHSCPVSISDTDTAYNFIVALAFSQMFNLLFERADNVTPVVMVLPPPLVQCDHSVFWRTGGHTGGNTI